MIQKFLKTMSRHKIIALIIFILLAGGGYFEYAKLKSNSNAVSYVSAKAEKGTIVVSVSGSGQVSALNQADVKSKVSGDVVYVGTENGQEAKAGTLLARLDEKDAQKSVRDAETSLEAAELTLEKLKKPADRLSILQAENSLSQAEESKQKAADELKKAYDDGFNTISNAFLDLPAVMVGLQDILFGAASDVVKSSNINYYYETVRIYDEKAFQYKNDADNSFQTARKDYDQNFQSYKSASRFSSPSEIESLIGQTYETTKNIAEAVKNTYDLIQFYEDKLTERNLKPQAFANTHLSGLNGYTGKTNSHLINLLSIKSAIQADKENIVNAERAISEKTESLAKLKAGADIIDVQSQELAIKQRKNALLDAKEKLADYFIYAPFDGVIAKINVKKGDSVSASVAIATLIAQQRLAEISLNEVDAAKVKIGQKTTLTFDAIPDLTLTGKVAEADVVGSVSQGVVSYMVKIAFDAQDERVKPGMSVSAAIITEVKQNVILIPNAAVKSNAAGSYVEILENNTPRSLQVETGLSNDANTEIVSGLQDGQQVVVQTITANASNMAQTRTQSGTGGFRIPGLGR